MLRRFIGILTALPRNLGLPPARLEILALFPLISIAAASFWSKSVAEATGIVLPALLLLDVFSRKFGRPSPAQHPVTDPRTGLPTRAAVDEALADGRLADGRMTTACLFIRIDGHDNLVQRWGAQERDEILRRTAERLKSTVRYHDTIGVIDSGTFCIVPQPVPAARPDNIEKLAERISASLKEPIHISGGTALITVSIGVATPGELPISDLAIGAEAALAEAQRLRPDMIRRFSRDLKDRLNRDTELARSVDRALSSGEIRAWFQPQVCTDSGQITGFEALARWHHPTFGTLSPGQFLDAIGNAGKLPRLGEVMLQNALTALSAWDRKGLKIPSVSVNFSSEELRDPKLADRVKWEVDRFDVKPSRLTVEILESVAALSQDDVILRNIDQFASQGFTLDLDDFGTGQASVQNIRRFRVQRIKIDRSFVTGIDKEPQQQSAVSAILAMAQHLGVETIAEGVETPGEYSILAQLGCGGVQGYGVARPMPFEDTFAWIDGHRMRMSLPPMIGRKTG